MKWGRWVHVSNMVNWVYQDNFKPAYFFFFYEKILSVKKTPRHKINNFTLLKVFAGKKSLPLLFFVCLFLFYLLVSVFFYAQNRFVKKTSWFAALLSRTRILKNISWKQPGDVVSMKNILLKQVLFKPSLILVWIAKYTFPFFLWATKLLMDQAQKRPKY